MIELTIDGQTASVAEGATILEAARACGIEIPTLCHHEALGGFGACRLCVVEIFREGEARESGEVVASCVFPASHGLIVETRSERVRELRRLVLDLLLARCPGSGKIRELAAAHGVKETSFRPDAERDDCILCGLCTRVCQVVGVEAIAAVGRGPDKEIATPFREPPEACIGCASCARCCPTENIDFKDRGRRRTIWDRDFELVACEACGRLTLTKEQAAHYAGQSGLGEDYFNKCDECQRREAAATFLDLMVEPAPSPS